MMGQITLNGVFCTVECCHEDCGITFAMTQDLYNDRRRDGAAFYCPRGHRQYFTGPSEEQKLKDRLERESRYATQMREQRDQSREQLTHANRSRAALKGIVTKTRNRIKNGVCPCCNRHFKNLGRHMKGQHPDYGDKADR